VVFDGQLAPFEIPLFRAAIIEKAGKEHLSFHNHLNDEEYLHGYPVIQYKLIRNKPALVCIDFGVDEIQHFFNKKDMEFQIGERRERMSIQSVNLNEYRLQIWKHNFSYRLRNWVPLNQENYRKYQQLPNEIEKVQMLERILIGNILSFAKGVKWRCEDKILCRITGLDRSSVIPYKEQKLSAFDIRFDCNVFLPNDIGLGKGVSKGFGTLLKQVEKRQSGND
jgi:hypothetical protein